MTTKNLQAICEIKEYLGEKQYGLIRTAELARKLSVHPMTIRRWIDDIEKAGVVEVERKRGVGFYVRFKDPTAGGGGEASSTPPLDPEVVPKPKEPEPNAVDSIGEAKAKRQRALNLLFHSGEIDAKEHKRYRQNFDEELFLKTGSLQLPNTRELKQEEQEEDGTFYNNDAAVAGEIAGLVADKATTNEIIERTWNKSKAVEAEAISPESIQFAIRTGADSHWEYWAPRALYELATGAYQLALCNKWARDNGCIDFKWNALNEGIAKLVFVLAHSEIPECVFRDISWDEFVCPGSPVTIVKTVVDYAPSNKVVPSFIYSNPQTQREPFLFQHHLIPNRDGMPPGFMQVFLDLSAGRTPWPLTIEMSEPRTQWWNENGGACSLACLGLEKGKIFLCGESSRDDDAPRINGRSVLLTKLPVARYEEKCGEIYRKMHSGTILRADPNA